VIWNNEVDEKKTHEDKQISSSQQLSGHPRLQRLATQNSIDATARGAEIRESQLYKRILGQSLKHVGLSNRTEGSRNASTVDAEPINGLANQTPQTPHLVPPKSSGAESSRSEVRIPGFTEAQNTNLVREVAEMAATAATIAARDATRAPRKTSIMGHHKAPKSTAGRGEDDGAVAEVHVIEGGGHDAPNWSRLKSTVILCGATLLYAMIAEILVGTVDVVLKNVAIDEKFLGITLFALVPNTTEFLVSYSIYICSLAAI